MLKKKLAKGLKIYLFSFAILMHIAFSFIILDAAKNFLYSSPTFAKAATTSGYRIQEDYPLLQPIGNALVSIGKKFSVEDYFWTQFDAQNWPSVGPKQIGHFTNAIPALSIEDLVFVKNTDEFVQAISKAEPGNIIVVKQGSYHFKKKKMRISEKTPNKEKPIYIVAEDIGKIDLHFDSSEGLYINQPYWRVIGFNFIGSCRSQAKCDHALHIVENASYFYAAHNSFIDFNAAIKVNKLNSLYPDNGIIEHNHFYFNQARKVKNSVTPINLDHGNNWIVSNNIIRDFSKIGGNKISYGMFIKGGVSQGSITNNLVLCSSQQKFDSSVNIGISIGGGGMPQTERRNNAIFEGEDIIIKNNIVMHCNDVGLYINKGKDSIILNNTLYNTAGIDLRYPMTSAKVENNVLNGKIRYRDNAQGELENNLSIKLNYWTGKNDLQDIYQSPSIGNFTIKNPEKIQAISLNSEHKDKQKSSAKDFCNQPLAAKVLGAVDIKSDCFYTKNNFHFTNSNLAMKFE